MADYTIHIILLCRGDVSFNYRWNDRSRYEEARDFLENLAGPSASRPGEEPVVFLIQTEEQLAAMRTFIRK